MSSQVNISKTPEYKSGKPIIVGLLAVILMLRHPLWTREQCFDEAEKWCVEFEKRC